MFFQTRWAARFACFLLVSTVSAAADAQHRPFAAVPPELEIEVIDPGVDSMGDPAVKLRPNGEIDIPPVVLVHRYYYSGDRSFQGPLLPGGPSILVVNHPKTGERVYVPTQMMPGAPRVIYTKKGITYQYPRHALILHFGFGGQPSIKYRSGLSWQQRVGKALHVEHVAEHFRKAQAKTQRLGERCKTTSVGICADVVESAKIVTVPVTNILQTLPFGKRLFTGELETYYAEKAAVFRRDKAIKHAEKRKKLDELTIRTNR